MGFGLWNQVFPDYVGIRKALKAVSQCSTFESEIIAEVPFATPAMQAVHLSKYVTHSNVCVYYCRTYYKAVREGGGG